MPFPADRASNDKVKTGLYSYKKSKIHKKNDKMVSYSSPHTQTVLSLFLFKIWELGIMFCHLKRNVCLSPIAMTTAAIPVDELFPTPRTIVNYIALYYVHFC